MPEHRIRTFLMFQGGAEEAIQHYTALLPDARIEHIERYGPDGPGAAGSVHRATFTLLGQAFECIDSPISHDFGFTPAISLFVDCADEPEFDQLHRGLVDGGQELMPPDDYGFSRRFVWLVDRHGVSWQINLPHEAGPGTTG
ncbi:VOC family protein [Saccharopolyspora sp. HNM0983]|uniref:VOC family protein n=1 Tax=Saccharopolyspora montiporae TaxID=2781240 RepID=A0A929B816_9PSEU|nr:VOC family protein [Saccharopolyspora sp. HNM0983]